MNVQKGDQIAPIGRMVTRVSSIYLSSRTPEYQSTILPVPVSVSECNTVTVEEYQSKPVLTAMQSPI